PNRQLDHYYSYLCPQVLLFTRINMYTTRYAINPNDFKKQTTQEIRDHYLIDDLIVEDKINLTYTMYDRFIVGGASPVSKPLALKAIDQLKAEYFLERRELGIINIGDAATVSADGVEYVLVNKEALYIGRGVK